MRHNPIERIGVLKSALIFTEKLNWVFREQPIVDVGMDALIEESLNGNPTGKLLAAQIKTGLGNFFQTNNSLILYITRIHCKYWLDFSLPIILLAYIPEDDNVYWQIIDEENIKKTKKQWKLEIPKNKILGENSRSELTRILYNQPQNDFIMQFRTGNISEEELFDIIEKSKFLNKAKDSLEALSEITAIFIEKQNKFVVNVNSCLDNGFSRTHPKVKLAIRNFSQVLSSTALQYEKEIDIFSDSFVIGFEAYKKLSLIDFELTDNYRNLQINFDRLNNFEAVINEALNKMKLFRNSISAFDHPHLKIAKKNLVETLNLMIAEFEVAQEMCLDFRNALDKILN